MTDVLCCKKKCLNNKNGICTAKTIEYDGLCQTYKHMAVLVNVITAYVLDHMENSKGKVAKY